MSDYDMPLHIGALFIILFVSAAAAGFPVLATRVPGLKIPSWVLFTIRHFGTGVIIGAAFVHLLPPAFVNLSDPCLGRFWVKDYPAISGVITMSSVFLIVVLEMLLHPACWTPRTQTLTASSSHQLTARHVPVEEEARIKSSKHEASDTVNTTTQSPLRDQPDIGLHNVRWTEVMTPEQRQRREILQCLLLELGILVHSVFIGMTLSVSTGNSFIVLLIAIIFHRKSNDHISEIIR